MAFRAISADVFNSVEAQVRTRKSQWDGCEVGTPYFMAQGIDYREDSSDNEELAKETSVRLSLKQRAKTLTKKLNKPITVKIVKRPEPETNQEGLSFMFVESTPAAATTATEQTTNS